MLFKKNFTLKIMLIRNFFFFKIVLFKVARNTLKMRILRGILNQNVIFCVQHFFQNLLFKTNFFFKNVHFRNLFSSKSCFLKKNLHSKSCFLETIFSSKSCFFKIERNTQKMRNLRVKLNQNLIFCVQYFF